LQLYLVQDKVSSLECLSQRVLNDLQKARLACLSGMIWLHNQSTTASKLSLKFADGVNYVGGKFATGELPQWKQYQTAYTLK
jgi:hypothetical protein